MEKNRGNVSCCLLTIIGAVAALFALTRYWPDFDSATRNITVALILAPSVLAAIGGLFHRTIAENLLLGIPVGTAIGFVAGLAAQPTYRSIFLGFLDHVAEIPFHFVFRLIAGRPADGWYEIALGGALIGASIAVIVSLAIKRYPDAAGR